MKLLGGGRIYRAGHISVQPSPVHGRGVFARADIPAGGLIEEAPLLLLTEADRELLSSTVLFGYYFLLSLPDTPLALALGSASFYNHGCPANARYRTGRRRDRLIIEAVRPIRAGDEITLNYNGDPDNDKPVQFDEHADNAPLIP